MAQLAERRPGRPVDQLVVRRPGGRCCPRPGRHRWRSKTRIGRLRLQGQGQSTIPKVEPEVPRPSRRPSRPGNAGDFDGSQLPRGYRGPVPMARREARSKGRSSTFARNGSGPRSTPREGAPPSETGSVGVGSGQTVCDLWVNGDQWVLLTRARKGALPPQRVHDLASPKVGANSHSGPCSVAALGSFPRP